MGKILGDDGIILELKVDDTPENAFAQMREKQYAFGFATGDNVGDRGVLKQDDRFFATDGTVLRHAVYGAAADDAALHKT